MSNHHPPSPERRFLTGLLCAALMVPLLGTAASAQAAPNCGDTSFGNSFGYWDDSYTRAGPRAKNTTSYVYMHITSITSGRSIQSHVDAWNGSSYIDASRGWDYTAGLGTTLLMNWVREDGYNSAAIAYKKAGGAGSVSVSGVWSPDYC